MYSDLYARPCYAGIDLGWTSGGSSGLAVFDDALRLVHCSSGSFSDEEILEKLAKFRIRHICIDSPLVVKNESGGRAVDSMIMRRDFHGRKLKMFATSRDFMLRRYGRIRGEELAGKLEQAGLGSYPQTLSETYPAAIIANMFPSTPPSAHKFRTRSGLNNNIQASQFLIDQIHALGFHGDLLSVPRDVQKEGVSREQYKHFEDALDALLCALAALYHSAYGSSLVFTDGENGCTVIPEPLV